MPYIGNNLATQFQAFATQTITGDGSTTYTLASAVANGKDILVYINNVKQEEGSGKSYEASGTTITFSEAVASGDSCYLVYMGSAQQTVTAPDGSIVSGQIANATLALPSGLTVSANTGIGTTSPDGTLHVKGISDHGRIIMESGGTSGANNNMFMQFHNNGGTEIAQIEIAEGASNEGQISFKTGGTTTAMTIDKDGHITKPLQSAFLAQPSSNQNDIPINAITTLAFGTERYDQNGDFSSNTFTAPVTGKYLLTYSLYFQYVDGTTDYLDFILDTSNRDYYNTHDPEYIQDHSGNDVIYFTTSYSIVTDMDANDTAFIKVGMNNSGASQMDLQASSTFSGCLLA